MVKKIFMIFLIMLLLNQISFSAQLYWFCAAAVKQPSKEIEKLFNETHPKDKVILIPGGTGQVLQQMILAKKGDIYTCLDEKFFRQAERKGIVERFSKVFKLIPVFGLSEKGRKRIKSFGDLFKKGIRIAGGNPKTMALGKTYELILKKLPRTLSNRLKENTAVYAINVSQIVNYLKMSAVDAGIIFRSLAKVNDFKFIEIPFKYNQIKTGYIVEITYGRNSKLKEELYRFILNHLFVYKKYGFTIIRS